MGSLNCVVFNTASLRLLLFLPGTNVSGGGLLRLFHFGSPPIWCIYYYECIYTYENVEKIEITFLLFQITRAATKEVTAAK